MGMSGPRAGGMGPGTTKPGTTKPRDDEAPAPNGYRGCSRCSDQASTTMALTTGWRL